MDQSGPARKQSLPLPMPRGRRLASASQDGCKDSAPDVERQSTRLPKETSRNCTPSVWGLYANVLRLSRRCRFGLARNCTGSPAWDPFVAWTGSELRHLIRCTESVQLPVGFCDREF